MNKLFTKIAALALGATMAVGVGVAVGTSNSKEAIPVHADNSVTLTASSLGLSNGAEWTGTTISPVTFAPAGTQTTASNTAKYYTTGSGLRLYTGDAFLIEITSDYDIDSATFTFSGSSYTFSASSITATGGTYSESGSTGTLSNVTSRNISIPLTRTCRLQSVVVNYSDAGGGGDTPTLSSIAVKTPPTKTAYDVGDYFDPTGLVITKTMSDSSTEDVSYASDSSNFSFTPDTSTALTASNTSVTIGYGGKTCSQAITVTEPTVSGSFNLFSGALVEGDYVICSGTTAMKNEVTSSPRIDVATPTIINNTITNPGVSIVWHLAKDGDYWTIYNAAVEKYAAFTSTDGRGNLISSITNYAHWEYSGTSSYDFTNQGKTGKYLRYNDGYGFASYGSGTGSALTLYKKHVAYTVQYNNNGGSGTMANSETIVSACTFTAPAGQEFDYWSTSSTGQGGTNYNPGDSVSGNCTLYAIWKDKIASVSVSPTSLALEIGGASKTVTATPTNIDNPSYSWAKSSGDNCISLTNDTTATVTVSVASGFNTSGSCTLTVTVTGTLGLNSVTRTADVEVTVTKTSTPENPYTVAEAMAVATAQGTTEGDTAYVRGYLIAKNDTGSQIFLTGDPDQIDVTHTLTTEEKHALLCVYKSGGVTGIGDVAVGDQVIISGNPVYYQSNQPEFASGAVISSVPETMTLSRTLAADTLTINSAFSYSGVVSIDYTHKTDVANANELVTFSGYDMSTTGNQTVTISYTDTKLNKQDSATYTLTVAYATITSLTVSPSSESVGLGEIVDLDDLTITVNDNANPNFTWVEYSNTVDDDYMYDSTTHEVLTGDTAGQIVFHAVSVADSSVYGVFTINVTGDPYVTFNKLSVEGIVGATLNNTVTATPEGLGTPTSYTWSIKSGEASDVVSATSGSATTTLTFLKAGSTILHVAISDGSKTAEGDIEVHVIKSLEAINTTSKDTQTKDFVFSTIASEEGWINGEAYTENTISPVTIEAQGGGNNGKWYTSGGGSWRMYSGGTLRISASNGYAVTSVTSSPTCTFTIADGVATFSPSARTDFTTISVTCEKTVAGTNIANTNYNAQKAILEFAADLTSRLDAVCLQGEGGTTVIADLNSAWTAIYGTYTTKRNGLSSSDQEVFDNMIKFATADESGDDLQKALRSYEWVYAKYHESLTSGDFLHETSGRAPVSYAAMTSPLSVVSESANVTTIIVIVSLASLVAIGGYFFLRKRKED